MASSLIAFATILALAPAAFADRLDELKPVCSGCHGIDGRSLNPEVPTLAGQPYTLIEDSLLAFRLGQRHCSPGWRDQTTAGSLRLAMCGFVATLSEDDVAALAAFFEQQDFVASNQDFDETQVARGREIHQDRGCERCHSDGGRTTNDMAPVLAGQWSPYLRRALETLQSGKRRGPKVMNAAIHEMNDEEIEGLLNFYASQQEGSSQ
jgi:sulfide dehydrogenase cytochrome subunit